MADESDLTPEERKKALDVAAKGVAVAAASLPIALLKALGWFGIGTAALLLALKFIGWIK